MKRLLLLITLATTISCSITGSLKQSDNTVNNLAVEKEKKMTLKSGNSAIDIQIKRCIAQGDDVIIDLFITCNTNWNVINFLPDGPEAYDDEGKLYKNENDNLGGTGLLIRSIDYEIDGNNNYFHNLFGWHQNMQIEEDIPRKLRILIKNVDEYASSFLSIKIPYLGNDDKEKRYNIIIKNLPIEREE